MATPENLDIPTPEDKKETLEHFAEDVLMKNSKDGKEVWNRIEGLDDLDETEKVFLRTVELSLYRGDRIDWWCDDRKDSDKVIKKCEKIMKKLSTLGISIEYDVRENGGEETDGRQPVILWIGAYSK